MIAGVLAVQGAFAEHERMLDAIGIRHFQIRQPRDLEKHMDGMILPGGESTVIGKLMRESGMLDSVRSMILAGLPVFGTCAGLILLSERICNDDRAYLATMPITARRNAYGRQLGSFSAESEFDGIGMIPMEFIRAPTIEHAGEGVEVLAEVEGRIVAARYRNQLATSFHPELTKDTSVHRYFADMMAEEDHF